MSTAAPLASSPDVSPSPAALWPLRTWPAVQLLGLMLFCRFVPPRIEDGPNMLWMVAGFGPLLCGLFIMIWWIAGSRARWTERLAGLLGMITLTVVTVVLIHPTMRGPAVMMLTIPVGTACFALGATLFGRRLTTRRTAMALLFGAIGLLSSTALRADGMWGNFALGLDWRWNASDEEKLLAQRAAAPASAVAVDKEAATANIDAALAAPEWAGYRGNDRDARQRGVQFTDDWSKQPPQELWRISVGPAWSSFAVAGKYLFTQEQRGAREAVVCYAAEDGREIWVSDVESRFDDPLGGPGPRATPTIADGKLFAMGAQGFLSRLDPSTGAVEWQRDLRKEASKEPPMWGFSSSPLIVDGVVIVYAGGKGDKGLLAFDAATGEPRWSAACGEHCYGSAHACEVAGEKLIAILSNEGLDLLRPATGEVRLKYEWKSDGYRAVQPRFLGDGVIIPSGMGTGTRLAALQLEGDQLTAKEMWTTRSLKPDFNDPVFHKGYLYGFDAAIFSCIDMKTGERRWKGGRYGKGQVLLLEDSDQLLVIGEQGELVFLKADPEKPVELFKLQALEGKTWNHPVVVGDRLYLRNAREAVCYRLTTR
ncbi:MAG: PQQ-binding-like beta-propeller repeat protein [Pirellulales bacterium]